MANVEDRLRDELRRLAEPGSPDGVVEIVFRRAARRRARKRLATVALALAVAVGTVAGTYLLVRVFPRSGHGTPAGGLSPAPIVPHANGLIAYANGSVIHTITPEGSAGAAIPAPGDAWLLAWSPDGMQLAVTIFPPAEGDRTIWVMDADGSDPHRVASADNVSQASWSPDGSTLAYAAKNGKTSAIHIVRRDGSDDRTVYSTEAPGARAVFSAAFSPDGTQILFDQGTDSGFDVFVMNADGSDVRRLTHTGHDYDPHWSPDGTRIAFTRQGVGPQSDIYVMDADGSHVRQLTDGGAGATNLYPEWSPDGTKIAYVSGRNGGPGGLVVMNPDGTDPVILVKNGVLGISWQPVPVSTSPTPSSRPGAGSGTG
ncbi:MAG: DPP IV N-terminal domain-containing protein [Actinomycetota bacterium]|nr:DPP IV N-terminal domain-containing protein [Actinomycetota bacterium]